MLDSLADGSLVAVARRLCTELAEAGGVIGQQGVLVAAGQAARRQPVGVELNLPALCSDRAGKVERSAGRCMPLLHISSVEGEGLDLVSVARVRCAAARPPGDAALGLGHQA